jgi:hypothetical protein
MGIDQIGLSAMENAESAIGWIANALIGEDFSAGLFVTL